MWSGRESGISIYGFYERESAQYRFSQGELLSRNRNERYDGLRNPKGYGPNNFARGPLRTETERCSEIRVGSGVELIVGGPVYRENGTLKERVQERVQWLRRKYARKQFERYYRGAVYTGVVRTVGWHPVRGFGATVTYNDGYSEILKISELEVLMLADRASKTDIMGQSIICKDTYGLGTVGNQPLVLVKQNSVEVEFVDQPSHVKVAKAVPKTVFLEPLESI